MPKQPKECRRVVQVTCGAKVSTSFLKDHKNLRRDTATISVVGQRVKVGDTLVVTVAKIVLAQ